MIDARELRIGNITKQGVVKSFYENGIHVGMGKTYSFDELKPIPLIEKWLLKMKDNPNKSTFPDWIRYVHEAQNWYYWNNNKTELVINWLS